MRITIFLLLLISHSLITAKNLNSSNFATLAVAPEASLSKKIRTDKVRIGFGSCAVQTAEQSIWQTIAANNPDLFILLGDNAYIDSADPADMQKAYQTWYANPNFKSFKDSTSLLATWDDHDYGLNDGGKEFVGKAHAKEAFIDFFSYDELEQLRHKPQGIYHARIIQQGNLTIQIIMLDTRWYRDDLTPSDLSLEQRKKKLLGPYQSTKDSKKQLLGKEQWRWLNKQFEINADVRIIASSIQVVADFTGWESWFNFPEQRKQLLNWLSASDTAYPIIISGDVHRGEISSMTFNGRNIIELTASGLDAKLYPAAPNKHRLQPAVIEPHFGWLEITKTANTIDISGSIRNINNQSKNQVTVSIEDE